MTSDISPAKTMKQTRRNISPIEQRTFENFSEVAGLLFHLLDDKSILLSVIVTYFAREMLPPEWARDAIMEAFKRMPKSWDDEFGKPWIDGKRSEMEDKAYREGQRLQQQGYKVSDDSLFPALGEALGLPSGTAKDYYYGKGKRTADRLSAAAKRLGVPKERVQQDDIVFGHDSSEGLERLTVAAMQQILDHVELCDNAPPKLVAVLDRYRRIVQEFTSEKRTPKIRKNKYQPVSPRKQRTSEK